MISGRYALRILFIIIFYFKVSDVIAQPALPDVAGSTDKGIVILSWICQYNGVRSITVLHSMDSVRNYAEIGHVKKKDKGIQAFVDGHPAAGKNFYKLAIIFNSGLSWTSNHCSVYVAKGLTGIAGQVLPENDSLQKFIVTEDINKTAATDTITSTIIRNGQNTGKNNKPHKDNIMPKPDTSSLFSDAPKAITRVDTIKKQATPMQKISVSFELDSSDIVAGMYVGNNPVVQHQRKITVTFEDPGENSTSFIKSRFIFTDPVTGHVNMELPDDVKQHHYSVKFYDEQNHAVIDVPKINTAKIIIDKRNFQHKGVYKFILRKDVTELEQGYIEIRASKP